MHGGQSRLRDGTFRRSLVLRGDQGRETILEGFREFATDYYGHTAGLSTIFSYAGYDDAFLRRLSGSRTLNSLLIDFCPAFREWVYRFAGEKAMELVIDYYGLYGDDRLSLDDLAYNLDLENAAGYKDRALKQLRQKSAKIDLGNIAEVAAQKLIREAHG
jgi:hypothetical protein